MAIKPILSSDISHTEPSASQLNPCRTNDSCKKLFNEFKSQIKNNSSLQLRDLSNKSWMLSKATSEDSAIMRPLQKEILNLNSYIQANKTALAQKLDCQETEVEKLMITPLESKWAPWISKVTLPFRVLSIVLRLLIILPIYAIASIFFKNAEMDPKRITNYKTPVLLVHGSSACQRQWDLFRMFIKGNDVGHIFSLNLNESAFSNDEREVEAYAREKLAPKLAAMKAKYQAAGYDMNEVILIGHSMGGLVSGAYATTEAEADTNVKVKALITMSSPWHGSPLGDKFISKDAVPEKAFRTDSVETPLLRKSVLEKASEGEMGLYTFNSSLDPIVPTSSSSLPIAPRNQIYHNNHDHYTSVADYFLARQIRDEWISQNTSPLGKES